MNGTVTKKQIKSCFALQKHNLLFSILISVSIPLVIFVAVPFDVFCSNFEEFGCRLSDFLPFCLLIFFSVSSLMFLILCFLKGALYRGVTAAMTAFSIMLFVQSNFMNSGISSLKGDNTENVSIKTSNIVVNTILWVSIILLFTLCGILIKNKNDIIKSICVVLSLTALVPYFASCIALMITTENLFGVNYSETPYFSTVKNLTTLSRNRNIFVFCIDRFDDNFYSYAASNTPEIFDELEGFTYFNNNTSLYGHTYPSISYMLTGKKFDGSKRKEYLSKVYKNAETFQTLKDNDYKINVYTSSYYGFDTGRTLGPWCDNFIEADKDNYVISSRFKLAGLMIKIALYRCLPYLLKSIVGNIGSSDVNQYISYNIDYSTYSLDMKKIYEKITSSDFELIDDNIFSFIHIEGCHSAHYDEDWITQIDIDTIDPAEINVSLKHSFEIINEYLTEMKKNGIYDDATIIITGDHCAAISDYSELKSTRLTALLVKPSGIGNGDTLLSTAPVSHSNLWGTIFASEGIKAPDGFSPSVFEVNESNAEPRYYYWHEYSRSKTSYFELIYKIQENARLFSNWSLKSSEERSGTLYK